MLFLRLRLHCKQNCQVHFVRSFVCFLQQIYFLSIVDKLKLLQIHAIFCRLLYCHNHMRVTSVRSRVYMVCVLGFSIYTNTFRNIS